ncbi:MAG: hypothetical protein ACE5LB_13100 [Acidiferrobacterales bacterium]
MKRPDVVLRLYAYGGGMIFPNDEDRHGFKMTIVSSGLFGLFGVRR